MLTESPAGLMEEHCEPCDASDALSSHPASLLTDLNGNNNNFGGKNNQTCWVSDSVAELPHNVSLVLPLGKKFEITYVSLQFCGGGQLADSLAILKSSNRGKTWTPFQFYSTECQKMYRRKTNVEISRFNEQVWFFIVFNWFFRFFLI